MDEYVARQPIFDGRRKVVAYELLFRSGPENVFPVAVDGDHASMRMIAGSMLIHGFDSLTDGKTAYVNVTRNVLVEKHYQLLPPERTVLEVLETVDPDEDTVRACREAKAAGYRVALDDFIDRPEVEPLLEIASIVKIDFLAQTEDARRAILARLARHKLELLAEKIESDAIFTSAQKEGYRYFQGYFFKRPEMIARRDVPTFKLSYLALLAELQRDPLDFDRIEGTIKRDVSLSVKLLRYLNSAAFYWRNRVTSIRHALALLGELPLRRWVALLALVQMASDRPAEAAMTCLVRGRFCELLAPRARIPDKALDLFFAGLLSAVDVLVGRPLPEIIDELGVAGDVRAALLELSAPTSPLARVVSLALSYERADWDMTNLLVASLRIEPSAVPKAYRAALEWARQVMPAA